jgi:hypothetical protein
VTLRATTSRLYPPRPRREHLSSRYADCAASRLTLQPNESRKVRFTLDRSDFGFYDNRGDFVVEPGQIEVYAGDSSQATMKATFTVTRRR